MEGHEPDPPEGWQDNEPEIASSKDDEDDAGDRTSVGGPAEQV
jgi:hypothetical protein